MALVTLLKAKLHRATVTAADLHYVGSVTIDRGLLERAGMYVYERVLIVDVDNGSRLEAYIIEGERGSGTIQLNGAAARLVSPGDRVIIMAFAQVDDPPPADWEPPVLLLDAENRVVEEL
ncbi:MAG: aspartate 1-decarboxylase [Anaerolineae bacterium]